MSHTDAVNIYVDFFGQLINASDAQATLRPIVQRYLTRIERDERGLARRLFPTTRTGEELGPRLVVIDPERRFGRPQIVGTGVETAAIAARWAAGESWSALASDFDLDEVAVAEAIRFETALRTAA